MTELRQRLARWLYRLAYRIDCDEDTGPRCVDCGIGSADGECEVCSAAQERDQMERSIYDEGHHDGYREAEYEFGDCP